jgi:UDP-N-acetylglucosamine 2-epimerase (non-hydrolysing)
VQPQAMPYPVVAGDSGHAGIVWHRQVGPRDPHRPRVLLVFGTRPEAIKMAPVAMALQARRDEFETWLCSTGQHREMLDQALISFGLLPDVDLQLMRPAQTLAELTARAVTALDEVLARVEPQLVLVQGDTTSAMVGALAAYYRDIPVGHLEAGLRTGDLYQPFPEEGNRRLISAITRLHFAPTVQAGRRLRREAIPAQDILVTGNTVIDALLHIWRRRHDERPPAAPAAQSECIVLLTMHRRESNGRPREEVCRAMLELVARNPQVSIVFPVHASPAVREPVERLLGGQPRIRLTDPLEYSDLVGLLGACHFVLTDSGGLQEEAPALGKPVLVLRDKTERPEAIRAGTARLVGTSARRILRAAEALLRDERAYGRMAHAANPYGDGEAAARVVGALRCYFGLQAEPPAPFAPPRRLPQPAARPTAARPLPGLRSARPATRDGANPTPELAPV